MSTEIELTVIKKLILTIGYTLVQTSQATKARYLLCSLTYEPVKVGNKYLHLKHIQDTKSRTTTFQHLATPQYSDVVFLVLLSFVQLEYQLTTHAWPYHLFDLQNAQ